MTKNCSKNLVLLRIGNRSLHQSLAPPDADRANWDLALSTYQEVSPDLLSGADYVHHVPGGKWSGVFEFFKAHEALLDRYEYIWIPDDDISGSPAGVDRLFGLMQQFGLELGQPSLSLDSYFYYYLTLHHSRFSVRRTNFVELMVPVFRRDLLKKVLPMFEGNWAGLGFDMVWPSHTQDPLSNVAVIDDVVVKHNGELATFLFKQMRDAGVKPMAEYRENLARHGIKPKRPMAHGGVLADGTEIEGNWPMMQQSLAMRWQTRGQIPHRPHTIGNLKKLVREYLTSNR